MQAEEREARVSEIVTAAQASGLRMTRQRRAVVSALVFSDGHPDASELYDRVRMQYPKMSRATVYKTIDMLKTLREVLELEFGEGRSRYEALRARSHPHLVCTGCGTIEDLFLGELEDRLVEVCSSAGYQIERYRIDSYGKCPRCREAQEQSAISR
jgi:Fur family transcriptional regulator, peroxide stress response regulator